MLVICNHKNICKVPVGKCYHASEHEAEQGVDDCRFPSECGYRTYDKMVYVFVACIEAE